MNESVNECQIQASRMKPVYIKPYFTLLELKQDNSKLIFNKQKVKAQVNA